MSRRTLFVGLGQLGLLAVVGWLAFRPVAGTVVFDWSRMTLNDPTHRHGGWGRLGDPLPWLHVTMSGNPDEFLYPPDGRPGFPSVVPNPDRTVTRTGAVTNPFAPVVGLLVAVCLPALLGRTRRWAAVGLAAAVGGLVAGLLMTAVEGGPRHGAIGFVCEAPPFPFLRDAWRGLRPAGWDDLGRWATLLGLLAGGAACWPWRTERTAQPDAARGQPAATRDPTL